ncbi:Csp1 family four helix bundle copper storage protein [Candidatus Raskinella chloraquaticus]|uniref:Csp1 family four helix bundle copper storage protein n=1 Tax=Candidatus Raskinella chloraquaticus TaxID=1951219 RepID=UPI0037864577
MLPKINPGLTRRTLALGVAAAAAWASLPVVGTGSAMAADGDPKHKALLAAAGACLAAAEICHAHCLKVLGTGDTSLKICAPLVSATIPVCQALVRLAVLDHGQLKEFAKACLNVCADCETECRKHAGHHAECKVCAEACAVCIRECKQLISA